MDSKGQDALARHAKRLRSSMANRSAPVFRAPEPPVFRDPNIKVPPQAQNAMQWHNAPEKQDDPDLRFARRRQLKTKATILGPNGKSAVHCVVRDISSTGVLIHLPVDANSVSRAGEEVHPRFTLQMPLERIEIDCELAWRQAHRIGARFVSPSRMIEAPERRIIPKRPVQKKTATAIVGRLFSR